MERAERVTCNQTACPNKNCAHRGEHGFYKDHCLRQTKYSKCLDTRCVHDGLVYVEGERENIFRKSVYRFSPPKLFSEFLCESRKPADRKDSEVYRLLVEEHEECTMVMVSNMDTQRFVAEMPIGAIYIAFENQV